MIYLSAKDRVVWSFQWGFYFHKTSHQWSFANIKSSQKFLNLHYMWISTECYSLMILSGYTALWLVLSQSNFVWAICFSEKQVVLKFWILILELCYLLGHNLPTSVNNRVILPWCDGFIFMKLASSKFCENKTSRKFPNLQYFIVPDDRYSDEGSPGDKLSSS